MWFLSLFLIYLGYFQVVLAQVNNKIIGGTPTTVSQYPYVISLYVNGKFVCGGSLIDSNTVITAGHCVEGKSSASLLVRAGRTNLNGAGGVSSGVTKIILSNEFNLNTMYMDIAILKLASPFPNITPVSLYTGVVPAGATVTALGWGYTSEGGSVSNQLRKVDVTTVSQQTCQNAYRNQGTISKTMMCATNPGKDSCNGDSGGPLIYSNRLVGVVSWGVGCARSNYPGVYTRIATTRSFINVARNM